MNDRILSEILSVKMRINLAWRLLHADKVTPICFPAPNIPSLTHDKFAGAVWAEAHRGGCSSRSTRRSIAISFS
jgi:hypothetical protein